MAGTGDVVEIYTRPREGENEGRRKEDEKREGT